MMPTLDTGLGRKMLSHNTSPIAYDNRVQKNSAAENAVNAWLAIRKICTLLKAVLKLSSAPICVKARMLLTTRVFHARISLNSTLPLKKLPV